MHEQILKKYTNIVVEISNEAQKPGRKGEKTTKIIFSEGVTFTLLDETVNKYESLVKSILRQNDLSHKFSEKYIERKLQSIIAKITQSNEKEKYAKKYLEDLINSLLSYNQEWIVLVPLSGLEVGLDSIKLGKITIFKMTQQKMEHLLTQFDKIALATKSTTEVKQRMIQTSHNIFVESLLGDACAKFQAIAEPERARERAEEETRRVLDILRYCIPFLYPSNLRVSVSLKGERNRQLRWTPIISCDKK